MGFGDKVILREVRDVPETRLEDLIGCTGYRGPAKTLKEMEAGTFDGPLAKRAKKIQREVGPPVDLLRVASS